MTASGFIPSFACAALSLGALAISLRQRRKQRLLADLPTSKTQGVFIGLVELCGTAESATPLRSFFREVPCVQYTFDVQEEWQRTVVETRTDKDGRTQTTTRVETGWTSIAHGGDVQDFYLRDETGVVLIRPPGATLEPAIVFEATVRPADPLYFAKAPAGAIPDSRHVRRFVEHAILLHAPLYVVGQARERPDVVAAEIAADKEAPLFLISTRTEKSVQRGHAAWSWFWWTIGLALAATAGAVAAHVALDLKADADAVTRAAVYAGFGGAGAFLIAWGLCWVWMVFNSLVSLRQRVRQGWSLIDVQLKRRHDLIPNLVAVVSRLSAHEQTTQTAVAALRTQLEATPPGVAGPDFDGVAAKVRAVAEKYPELVAQEGFTRLHQSLVETEERIALARSYYNDIATQFATRLERIPDRWVAALTAMRPEPLLTAAHFERAPIAVAISDTKPSEVRIRER